MASRVTSPAAGAASAAAEVAVAPRGAGRAPTGRPGRGNDPRETLSVHKTRSPDVSAAHFPTPFPFSATDTAALVTAMGAFALLKRSNQINKCRPVVNSVIFQIKRSDQLHQCDYRFVYACSKICGLKFRQMLFFISVSSLFFRCLARIDSRAVHTKLKI